MLIHARPWARKHYGDSIQPSPVSPNGVYLATLTTRKLEIRASSDLRLLRAIPLVKPSESLSEKSNIQLQWSPGSRRILLCAETTTRVWDVLDSSWKAVVDNGSGSMGKIVYAAFAGATPSPTAKLDASSEDDEVLLFSDFAARLTVWSLSTGRSVEIKDPKFAGPRSYGYRPVAATSAQQRSSCFALLSRPGSQDVLTLHAPQSYHLIGTVNLKSVDAQGLKWSPDGMWLAIWDAASAGTMVYIHTADGHLYRTYYGATEAADGSDIPGLGVRSLAWSPRGDYLAIGGHDSRVTLVSTRTFTPLVYLDHTPVIQLSDTPIWSERLAPVPGSTASDPRYTHTYEMTPLPVTPPSSVPAQGAPSTNANSITSPPPTRSIVTLLFSPSGRYIATQTSSNQTTLWLWDLNELKPATVVLQHGRIRNVSWHSKHDILSWTCADMEAPSRGGSSSTTKEAMIYSYSPTSTQAVSGSEMSDSSSTARPPTISTVPLQSSAGGMKLVTHWLPSVVPTLLVSDTNAALFLFPNGRSAVASSSGPVPELSEIQEEEEEDSLMDALMGHSRRTWENGDDEVEDHDTVTKTEGRTAKLLEESGFGFVDEDDEDDDVGMVVEDTFHGRRR